MWEALCPAMGSLWSRRGADGGRFCGCGQPQRLPEQRLVWAAESAGGDSGEVAEHPGTMQRFASTGETDCLRRLDETIPRWYTEKQDKRRFLHPSGPTEFSSGRSFLRGNEKFFSFSDLKFLEASKTEPTSSFKQEIIQDKYKI